MNESDTVVLLWHPSLGCYLDDVRRGWTFETLIANHEHVRFALRIPRGDVECRMRRIGVG